MDLYTDANLREFIVSEKKKPPEGGFCITGGSGEIRTRDQRIKRSRGSSKLYINQWPIRLKNDCAIDCAIAFWCKVRIHGPDFELLSVI